MKLRQSAAWLAAAALCLLSAMPAASAAIHHCTGPDGKAFFSDSPCPMASGAKHAELPELSSRPVPTPPPAAAPVPAPAPAAAAPAPADLPPPPARVAPPVILPAEQGPAPSLLERLPASSIKPRGGGHIGAALFGLLVLAGASIWFLVIAFSESVVWGLLVLFVPFAGLVFTIMHWSKVWRSLLVSVAGSIIMITAAATSGPAAQVAQSELVPCTTEGQPTGPAANSFSSMDFICLKSALIAGSRRAPQTLTWKWYTGATPTDVNSRSVQFEGAPLEVNGAEGAFSLGPGPHKVELYLDGELLETKLFSVH